MSLLPHSQFSGKLLLPFHVVLFLTISLTDSKRISLKESLTAFAEKSKAPGESEPSLIPSSNQLLQNKWDSGSPKPREVEAESTKRLPLNVHLRQDLKDGIGIKSFGNLLRPSPGIDVPSKFSMILSDIAQPAQQNETKIDQKSEKPLVSDQNNSTQSRISSFQDWPHDDKQLRNKKEASSTNPGLKGLFWNTATALWSVNKEHFLPTFLHTKTGGKLSLGRNSLFEPVNILSQFKHGVKEINNQKRVSLERLSRGGWGWSSSGGVTHPNVLLVSVQRNNNVAWTLARYLLRLTRHTATTKYKLSRAVLRLQLRAIKKLIRILRSRTFAQTVATVKILTNAALTGKRAVLEFIVNLGEPAKTTPHPYYDGVDNSNVDITYNSIKHHQDHHASSWSSYKTPEYSIPPQKYSPAPAYSPPDPQTPYYAPPKSPNSLFDEPSHAFVPPVPLLQAATFTNFGHFAPPPQSSTANSLLIETPSYANLLQQMGIDPVKTEFKENSFFKSTPAASFTSIPAVFSSSSSSPSNPSSSSFPTSGSSQMSPSPTIVYYSSTQTEKMTPPPPPARNINNVYFTTETPPTATFSSYLPSASSLSTTISVPAPSSIQRVSSPLPQSTTNPTPQNASTTTANAATVPVSSTSFTSSLATESSNSIDGSVGSENAMSLSKLLKSLALRNKESQSTSSAPSSSTTSYTTIVSSPSSLSTSSMPSTSPSVSPSTLAMMMTSVPAATPTASPAFRMKLVEAMFGPAMTSRQP